MVFTETRHSEDEQLSEHIGIKENIKNKYKTNNFNLQCKAGI